MYEVLTTSQCSGILPSHCSPLNLYLLYFSIAVSARLFSAENGIDYTFAFVVELAYVGFVFGERAQRLRVVEVLVELDFAAYLCLRQVYPCIGHVGQHLAPEVSVDVFGCGHLLGVAQRGVGLILHPLLALGMKP